MVDVRNVIASLFVMLKQDIYVLIRIEALVAVVTVIFLVMFIMDFYRCRTRNSIVTTVLKTIDALSGQILVYLIGAMQAAKFQNQLFPVWAVVLVSLHASIGYLSGYGISDRERRLTEVGNVIKFIGAGVLNGTRGLHFARPLWSLWAILQLKSLYRFFGNHRAISSLWHGRSSEFLPDYMRSIAADGDHEQGISNPTAHSSTPTIVAGDHAATPRAGDKYLVYGESNQDIKLNRPQYTLNLDDSNAESLITMGKIWGCQGKLLTSDNTTNGKETRFSDMTLAFSLSRLLRCRLEDVTLHEDSIHNTRDLFKEIIAKQVDQSKQQSEKMKQADQSQQQSKKMKQVEDVRLFRILELDLAFVRDYFYTLYPMVFWQGLGSLCFSLVLSTAAFAVALWLAVGIRKVYHHSESNVVLRVSGWNVDVIITWVFMFFMMFKEVWEMVTYLISNWTRLLLVCKYAQSHWFQNLAFSGCLIRSFFKSKIADPWHGRIDQYDFLQSCTYKPSLRKVAHFLTLGKIQNKSDGKKSGEAIKIPPSAKLAIVQALNRIDLSKYQLPKEQLSGSINKFERYKWACLEVPTCSQVILVWHIATSLCEINLAQDKNIDLGNPGFLHSAWSYLKKKWCSCSSQQDLVPDNINFPDGLRNNYHIANILSRYCAYLQVFRSQLLPDSFVVPNVIFGKTLADAQKCIKDRDSIKKRYEKLMVIADEPDSEDAKRKMNIVEQGVILAKELIKYENEETRWEILAEVWAELLVHIAPSWNAADHKACLESGGEFITLIWALLWHCGIEESNLWTASTPDEGSGCTLEASTEAT